MVTFTLQVLNGFSSTGNRQIKLGQVVLHHMRVVVVEKVWR